jgi:hypothetical protein
MLPSCGMKNAFIMLAEVNSNCSGTPAGTVSVFDVGGFLIGIDEQPLPVERYRLNP